MKRHLVMDLFYGPETEINGNWNKIEDGFPESKTKGCKVKVRLANGNEVFAYFYTDLGTFFECTTKEKLTNITHWVYLKREENGK